MTKHRFFTLRFALLMTWIASATASATEIPRYLISVQDFKKDSKEFTQRICNEIQGSEISTARVTCASVSAFDMNNEKIGSFLSAKSYDYHLEIIRQSGSGRVELTVYQFHPEDPTDFKKTSMFLSGTEPEIIENTLRYFKNLQHYHQNKNFLKIHLVSELSPYSKRLKPNPKRFLIDSYTGKKVSWKQAYRILREEDPRVEQTMTTLIELSAILGFASYKYYENLVVNETDFDIQNREEKIDRTVFGTSGWSFDTNKRIYNLGHAFAGVVYYQTARANGFDSLKSFGISFGASLFWEILGEYKEKASINDQVITPFGGAILGEVGYQVARALRNKSNAFVSGFFSGVLDPSSSLNILAERFGAQRRTYLSDLNDQEKASLVLSAAASPGSDSKKLGFEADIVNIPGFGEKGRDHGLVLDTAAVRLTIEKTQSKLGPNDLKFLASVAWAAYYEKEHELQNGYEWYGALSSGVDYREINAPVDDFNMAVHIVGSTIQLNGYYRGFKLSTAFDILGDFAMMNSLAISKAALGDPNAIHYQSVVQRQQYYFGFGFTNRIRLALTQGRFTIFADASQSKIQSFDHWDRVPESATEHESYRDAQSTSAVGASLKITPNVRLIIKQERLSRKSAISTGYSDSYKLDQSFIQLEYVW
jgi:hypothetical protein